MILNTLAIATTLRLLGILVLRPVFGARKQCFNLEQELSYCARKHKVQIPNNPMTGYDFGYGSLNETEYMCRTKWHILVFRCMRRRSEQVCKNSDEEKFRQVIWSISLDTRKLEKAAAYMCHEHNLRILQQYQDNCLRQQEKLAEQCTVNRNDTIREVVAALQNQSNELSATSLEYSQTIKNTLTYYECKSLRAKLECLYSILHTTCPPDALRLVMNYFKETLPDYCDFEYEDRLQLYLDNLSLKYSPPEAAVARTSTSLGRNRPARNRASSEPGSSGRRKTIGSEPVNFSCRLFPSTVSLSFLVLLTILSKNVCDQKCTNHFLCV
ncbi:unnamed protein product [Calicophoron daubneyi]|uniref:Uncharacterized protein n=1 Tax=Calicophoron daubneyi TaxID=300641 RepID=A0AAV2T7J0_CALDB